MRSNASTFTRWISPETNLQPGHIALFWWLGLSDNGTVTCDQLRALTPAWLRVSASQCSPSPSPSPWWGTLRTEDQELHAEGEKEQLSHTRGCQSPGPWATSGPTTTYVCLPTGYYFNKQTNKQKTQLFQKYLQILFVLHWCGTLLRGWWLNMGSMGQYWPTRIPIWPLYYISKVKKWTPLMFMKWHLW